ncbi:MAG: hypothetical protein MUO99_05130 [Dehalococcoidales bacterium]|nr:hypothetical protein [Dehalococcoidales bacterium]
MTNIKWINFKFNIPPCSSYRKYLVIRNDRPGLSVDVCAWIPTEHYTNGFWATLGHGAIYGQDPSIFKVGDILFWAELPKVSL